MSYYITKVCKSGNRINKVKLSNGTERTKKQVINSIISGNTFYTQPEVGRNALVRAIPRNNPKYIRSVPDDILADNLGRLPEYC